MAKSSISDSYTNIVHETTVDGGWSGHLRIVVGTSNTRGGQPFIFVDSDLLGPRRLVLTSQEALNVAAELAAAACEVVPPPHEHPEGLHAHLRLPGAGRALPDGGGPRSTCPRSL